MGAGPLRQRISTPKETMTMAFAFDTLGYSKHLQDAGVARGQADAHAELHGTL